MRREIAVVGLGCIYPDARSPSELWENVLAGRRAFRRIPPERLRDADYWSPDRAAADRTYSRQAAVIEGWEFDRLKFRVVGSTYRSADPAHWLALDVASRALEDAGFPDGRGLPKETTGVLLGNTLTGEFSRANVLRLRWPYVRRTVDAALAVEGWSEERRTEFLVALESRYKEPFPEVGEETLAGGLSNTIAGRICNHFDLKGGGYVVDGACSSSLLAVANSASALADGELDVALAGGVDLSLDPFELVGFAKTGALAPREMRVYDAESQGFWPGEGCGFAVLMRREDAEARGAPIYAVVRGWGISSDGAGGITRPEVEGQLLAVRRAYRKAGFGPDEVAYFEGHGTGTAVGDETELTVLGCARAEADAEAPPAPIGSVKANFGHTKAAAGIAGFIKAVLCVHHRVVPPAVGTRAPHPALARSRPYLRIEARGAAWTGSEPMIAGVSSMGFGGINAHIVLEGAARAPRPALAPEERRLLRSWQDAELFVFAAADAGALRERIERVRHVAPGLALAELTDLAAALAADASHEDARAACVAATPEELAEQLDALAQLDDGGAGAIDERHGRFVGLGRFSPRVGFLFPGQGAPAHLGGGLWARRFDEARDAWDGAGLPAQADGVRTEIAQPAIVTASRAALLVLERLGLRAGVGIGHSLGELSALYWAGAWDAAALQRTATARGRAMAALPVAGAMASVRAGADRVRELLDGTKLVVAGLNAPERTVVAGEEAQVRAFLEQAAGEGLPASRLPVSHAFHSPLVAAAAEPLAAHLAREELRPPVRNVVSTVTGRALAPGDDLRALLVAQVTEPVRFEAAMRSAGRVDLWIEVGPGETLAALARSFVPCPVVALDSGGESLRGLLGAVGAAFALGADVDPAALFQDRFTRPFSLERRPRFLANPCESAPASDVGAGVRASAASPAAEEARIPLPALSPLEIVRELVAARAELPAAAVADEHRMLSDLHLNSITVSQIVVEAARRGGFEPPASPTDWANATVAEIAQALGERVSRGAAAAAQAREGVPQGVGPWVRAFTVELVERARPAGPAAPAVAAAAWRVFAPEGHPLAEGLRRELARSAPGPGVALCVPADPGADDVAILLEAARTAIANPDEVRFLVVQQGGGGAPLARTLCLEAPWVSVTVCDLPFDHPDAASWAAREARSAASYSEAHFDASGRRTVPVLRLRRSAEPGRALGAGDVLLVTGGGKGIGAECALELARRTGVRLALLGRSSPGEDEVLAANLARLRAASAELRYERADVGDAEAVRRAFRDVESALGPVTAVLHAAGENLPTLLGDLDPELFRRTVAPKVDGARNLLAAADPARLHTFVAFSSIIRRVGLPGEAHYATANEWLARVVEKWSAGAPGRRGLVVDWSVWAGVGMGERLGRVQALRELGVMPITTDDGVRALADLVGQESARGSIVVTGRFGDPPTLAFEPGETPFLRFLEDVRWHVPGVEIVADSQVSVRSDPYLEEHVLRGERLLPAVMGLEAMAQAWRALTGRSDAPVFENVQFHRPIAVAPHGVTTIRCAALACGDGQDAADVVLRTDATSFRAEHFRATCRASSGARGEARVRPSGSRLDALVTDPEALLPDPERDLYGAILFHAGRFRRLRRYRRLRATECVAEIGRGPAEPWFERTLPQELVLGDAAARDAAVHAVQACIPHAVVLPVAVEAIERWPLLPGDDETGLVVRARERSRSGDEFVYDLEIAGADGRVREAWSGLRLKAVEPIARGGSAPPLLAPWVERRLGDLVPGADVHVAVARNGGLSTGKLAHRPDGKPQADGIEVSVARTDGLTLAVAGPGPLGCDVEAIVERPAAVWRDLLGLDGWSLASVLVAQAGESEATAATRVWAAAECLKKAGVAAAGAVSFVSRADDGWMLLSSGSLVTATVALLAGAGERPVVLAIATRARGT